MKKVDFEHFSRFLCPHTLTARGGDLYFCIRKADLRENRYRSDLWLLRGGTARQLTFSGDVGEYHLLPGGVVFASLREKKDRDAAARGVPLTVLQMLPYDGGEAAEFLRLPYSVSAFCFLSETRFFFTARISFEFEAALSACGGNAEKAAVRLKESADCRVMEEIPFARNGEGFTSGLRSRLFLFDSGRITQLSAEDASVALTALSPDGKKLWYTGNSYRGKNPLYEHLYEMNTATLKVTDATVGERDQYWGVWPVSAGKTAIAASVSAKHGLNENAKLYLREGGKKHLVLGDGALSFGNTVCTDLAAERTLTPEPIVLGKEIVVPETSGCSSRLIALDTESGSVRAVTKQDGCITEAVRFGDGFAMVAMRGSGGCEVYSVAPDGTETRLTDLNTALCAEYAFSAPLAVSFHNTRGTLIEGWVIPPVGKRRGQKYPTILDIHGGPKTVYGTVYFHEMQLWANRGFAVIYCNPSGSDGRGDAFADIRGDYGGQDFRDLMAFADEAAKQFDFIDPKRMGVTGGSYGGFMTNWIIGHTVRFRAAVSQRSISNWISYCGTADIGYFFAPDQTGGNPWHDARKAWDQSPLRYADKVKTPTLFLHSDEDYRCPLSGGYQMFTALCAHGVPARLCVFHGENHELSRSGKPKNRVRRLKEITAWMEKYLKA